MSARILSMGSTTLRFARASHEIACRHFLTHRMYIGSSTRRFRNAATRRQATRARRVVCNRYPTYQELFEVGKLGQAAGLHSFSYLNILYPAGIRYA
jgi:hypothetical protein